MKQLTKLLVLVMLGFIPFISHANETIPGYHLHFKHAWPSHLYRGQASNENQVLVEGDVCTTSHSDTVIYLSGIAQLTTYAGIASTVIVDTVWTGGTFNLKSGALAAYDYGINFPSAVPGKYWQREITPNGRYNIQWWGARPDSTQDNSVQIQRAINYISQYATFAGGTNYTGGGILDFPPGSYIGNDTLKSNVTLMGSNTIRSDRNGQASDNTIHAYNAVVLTAAHSGAVIITPAGATSKATCVNAGVVGITIYGLGAGVPLDGIDLVCVTGIIIDHCAFDNISHRAIWSMMPPYQTAGNIVEIHNIFVQNCLLDMTPYSTYTGVVQLDGTSNTLDGHCEIAAGTNGGAPSSNGFRCAVAVTGSEDVLDNINAEFGDVNYYFGTNPNTKRIMGTNLRSDSPQKESIIIDGAQNIQLQGYLLSGSQLANNVYSNIVVKGGAGDVHLIFDNMTKKTNLPAYLLSDSLSSTDNTQRNTYYIYGPSTAYATGRFNMLNSANLKGSLPYLNPNLNIDNTATPNVNGYSAIYVTNNTNAITNFIGGQSSQEITVVCTKAKTINNSSNIVLLSGVNTTFPINTVLKFINYLGVWYQESQGVVPITSGGTGVSTLPAGLLKGAGTGAITAAASGQVALLAGTKAITITGLTTSGRAILTLVSAGGTVSTTWQYAAVCTTNTLTITALTNTGSTNTTDTSTLNYLIVN